jgi:hypothetical protein
VARIHSAKSSREGFVGRRAGVARWKLSFVEVEESSA